MWFLYSALSSRWATGLGTHCGVLAIASCEGWKVEPGVAAQAAAPPVGLALADAAIRRYNLNVCMGHPFTHFCALPQCGAEDDLLKS